MVKGKVGKRQQTNPLPKDAVIISVKDSYDMHAVEFSPLRDAGPHVPLSEVNALSLFELFFDDTILERILNCTFVILCSVQEE